MKPKRMSRTVVRPGRFGDSQIFIDLRATCQVGPAHRRRAASSSRFKGRTRLKPNWLKKGVPFQAALGNTVPRTDVVGSFGGRPHVTPTGPFAPFKGGTMTAVELGQRQSVLTIPWTLSRYRTKSIHTLTLVVSDTLAILAAAAIALLGRDTFLLFDPAPHLLGSIVPIAALFVSLWLTMLAGVGAYQIEKVGVGSAEFNAVLLGTFFAAGALGVTAYLTAYDLSRGFYVLLFLVGLPLLLVERFFTRRLIRVFRNNGMLCAPVILVGDHQHVDEIAAVLRRATFLGYRLVGVLSPTAEDELTPSGLPVLGSLDDIIPALRATSAQTVIFTDGALPSVKMTVWADVA